MPDVFIGEFDSDIEQPTIVNKLPAPAATNVSESTNVSFDVLDTGAGINTASLDVDVDGTPALINGVSQPGFVVSITPIVNGFHVGINPNTDFTSLSSVSVYVFVQDLASIPNSNSASWNFATGDFKPPTIVNKLPVPGSLSVPVTSHVSFDALDVNGSGINPASINVSVNGEDFTSPAIVNGVFQTGYTGSITAIVNGVHVDIVSTQGLLYYELYTVVVSVADNGANTANASWQFNTDEGVIETPRLNAIDGLDSLVSLYWTTNPALRVTRFELRRSIAGYPLTPSEGELVYQGSAKFFNDIDVVNGTTYYYTVFVTLKTAPLVYVPYDPQASDDVVPAAVRVSQPVIREYVPYSGELGVVNQPWPYGRLTSVFGANDYDTWTLPRGRKIVAPVSGTVVSLSPLALDTASGVRVTMAGQLKSTVTVGSNVVSGRPVADSRGGEVTLRLVKLAVAEFGERVIRPSYLYLAVDRR